MENKKKDAGKAICFTLGEVRKLLDMLPIAGKNFRVGLVNADNALGEIIATIESGSVVVTAVEKNNGTE